MADVNYAESYSKALAQKYATAMYFGALFTTPNNSIYKPIDSKTIKIPVLTVTGRKDGTRDSITGFSRSHDNTWEAKELTNHRCWDTLVHPMDVTQSNMIMSISNATSVFNSEQKLPEKQKYLVSKLYALTNALNGHIDAVALTADIVLAKIDKIAETMDEANIPASGRMLYVTPITNTMIKNAKELSRFLTATDGEVARSIHRIDDFEIVSVPSDLMKTAYNFTTGATVGAGAKQIQMFAVHPLSIITPESYSYVGMQEPSTLTKGMYAYYEEAFEDVFILNQRKDGLYFVTAV